MIMNVSELEIKLFNKSILLHKDYIAILYYKNLFKLVTEIIINWIMILMTLTLSSVVLFLETTTIAGNQSMVAAAK